MCDIPGTRIAETLAEVGSHIAETGEDPRVAFGAPKAYAASLAGSLNAGLWVWLIARVHREADRVLDPRTGRNMAAPLPRWAVALLVATPCGMLLLGHLIGGPGR